MSYPDIRSALRQGTELLGAAGAQVPRLTAEVLLGHALRRERAYLFAHPERGLSQLEWIHYGRYLHQRIQGMPTQYITQVQEFYGRTFRVTPDVLIPRPETEHLVEAAIPLCSGHVVEAGCGSGAIAITLALEAGAVVTSTDISYPALQVARQNADSLGASVNFIACDLLSALADNSARLVVSNPPYIRTGALLAREVRDWEPAAALFAGEDGLAVYRGLIPEASRVLQPGGFLALELGFDSLPGVIELLRAGFLEPRIIPDLAGIPRVLVCGKAG
ncbi:MAG: peptide chain release factor N(5)-glutamine methyltransferase [Acidobacteriota bacterium]|nr:peptide chain release factor N(5)-glutamine methyltransferase [Acidobacteriota bacterium]